MLGRWQWWLVVVEVLALAEKLLFGGGAGFPTGGDLLLSDRGLATCDVAVSVAVTVIVIVVVSHFSRPLSSGTVSLRFVISDDNDFFALGGGYHVAPAWKHIGAPVRIIKPTIF